MFSNWFKKKEKAKEQEKESKNEKVTNSEAPFRNSVDVPSAKYARDSLTKRTISDYNGSQRRKMNLLTTSNSMSSVPQLLRDEKSKQQNPSSQDSLESLSAEKENVNISPTSSNASDTVEVEVIPPMKPTEEVDEATRKSNIQKELHHLLRTEERFVQQMKAIGTLITSSESLPDSHIPKAYTQSIFKDIPKIAQHHSEFLADLLKACSCLDNPTSSIPKNLRRDSSASNLQGLMRRNTITAESSGAIMSKSDSSLKDMSLFPLEKIVTVVSSQLEKVLNSYSSYLNGIVESLLCLAECCQKFPRFNSFVEKTIRAKQYLGLDLSQLLTSPFEPIEKYLEVFTNILQNTDNTESIYSSIASVINTIQQWMTIVDFKLKEGQADNMVKLYRIQRRVIFSEGKGEIFLKPNRKVIREGPLTIHLDKEKQPVYVFLFNDMLLYAKRQELYGISGRPRSNSLRETISSFAGLPSSNNLTSRRSSLNKNLPPEAKEIKEPGTAFNEYYKYMGQITLEKLIPISLKMKNIRHAFQISTAQSQFVFEAPSMHDKRAWLKDLENLNKEEERKEQLEIRNSATSSSTESLSPPNTPPTPPHALLTNNATKMIEQRLNEREWLLLLTNSTELTFKKNETVRLSLSSLYRLKVGTLRLERKISDGTVIAHSRIEVDRIFGATAIEGSTVVADSDSVVILKLRISFLKKLFQVDPVMGMKFYKQLGLDYYYRVRTLPPSLKAAIIGETKNQAITAFNIDPKQGVNYFIDGYLKNKSESERSLEVAKFLRENHFVLDKTKIGDYLGMGDNKHPFQKEVLAAYVNLFTFKNLGVDNALREFLSYFRIPGEAQKIDRIMASFAKRFFVDNPEFFNHEDAVYVLSFSIMMLATDLHNPNVKKKMNKEDWMKNNTGINKGQDFDKQFLLDIYDRIMAEPLKLKEDDDHNQDSNTEAIEEIKDTKEHLESQILRKKFKLDKDDLIIKGYPCIYKREGTLYLTQKNICFYSKIFGFKEKKVLPFMQVVALEKDKNADLLIRKLNQQLVFTFVNPKDRDEAHSLARNIWEKLNQQYFEKSENSKSSHHLGKTTSVFNILDDMPTEDDWTLLIKNSKLIKLYPGEVIAEEGSKFQRVYQIVKGVVRSQQSISSLQQQFKLKASDIGEVRTLKSENSSSIFRSSSENLKENDKDKLALADSNKSSDSKEDKEAVQVLMTKFRSQDLKNFFLKISKSESFHRSGSFDFKILELLGPSDIFGELSFLESESSLVSYVAETEVETYVMEGFVLNRIFEWKP